jgi:hypothetical protein
MEYKVVQIFMGQREVEAEYDTKEEAKAHILKAQKQEYEMGLFIKSKFDIEESE